MYIEIRKEENKMTKSIQSEVMTLAWALYQYRTELSMNERYEDLDVYDFSEVLTFAWSEIKEERKVQAKLAKQNAWMAPIGKKILDESGITLDEYFSGEMHFVAMNEMRTANLFETESGRTIWLSSRQEEMILAYNRVSK